MRASTRPNDDTQADLVALFGATERGIILGPQGDLPEVIEDYEPLDDGDLDDGLPYDEL